MVNQIDQSSEKSCGSIVIQPLFFFYGFSEMYNYMKYNNFHFNMFSLRENTKKVKIKLRFCSSVVDQTGCSYLCRLVCELSVCPCLGKIPLCSNDNDVQQCCDDNSCRLLHSSCPTACTAPCWIDSGEHAGCSCTLQREQPTSFVNQKCKPLFKPKRAERFSRKILQLWIF